MVNFDELQKRVEARGGTLKLYTGDEGFKVIDITIPMVISEHMFPHTAAGHKILNGFLDSLEAKDKARRCVELIEVERMPRVGVLQYENACNHAINAIRHEFDIEVKK